MVDTSPFKDLPASRFRDGLRFHNEVQSLQEEPSKDWTKVQRVQVMLVCQYVLLLFLFTSLVAMFFMFTWK